MDEMLASAPCGFLTMTLDGIILETNTTLLSLLGDANLDLRGRHFELILPGISLLLFRSYLQPLLVMRGRADEIFLSIQIKNGREVPSLVNILRKQRDGIMVYDFVFMPMYVRIQYEDDILRAKKSAEEAIQQRNQVIASLEAAQKALDAKQIELVEINTRLEELALTDELTNLWNRRAFIDQIDYQIALAQRFDSPVSLLFVDVDNFKKINDSWGHLIGDQILKTLAVLLLQSLRKTDFAARYGGEEFVVLLPHTDQVGAVVLAEKLRKDIETASVWEHPITVSIGVSTQSADITGVDLILLADQAMYKSKQRGRNCVTHFATMA